MEHCQYQSNMNYSIGNDRIYSTAVLKFNLCDYNDAYILVRGDITIIRYNPAAQVAFKKCALFTKCTTKIDGTKTDDAKDLDLVMLMYNFLEYRSNYSDTICSLWFHSKDEATNFKSIIENTNNLISFMYKAKLLGNTDADGVNGL